jgi:hypothetical protein
LKSFIGAILIAWIASVFAVMLVGGIASGQSSATTALSVLMIGPIMLAVTAIPVATASVVAWWLARRSHWTAVLAAGIYLVLWTMLFVIFSVPPMGEAPTSEDIANAIWFGPVFAAVFGALLALLTSYLSND